MSLLEEYTSRGVIGPFPSGVASSKLDDMAEYVRAVVAGSVNHPIYNRYSMRDWHLVPASDLMALFNRDEVVSVLTELLGCDLLLWRSKIFYKKPSGDGVGWHQEWGDFNGEEIGNDQPSLQPISRERIWDLTVWVALNDIDESMGPIRFAPGSHHTRYAIEMANMGRSEFFDRSVFDGLSVAEVIQKANDNMLILDMPTEHLFDDQSQAIPTLSMEEALQRVMDAVGGWKGAVTVGFDPSATEVWDRPLVKGDVYVFSERVMHGSGPNRSIRDRVAVNARVTTTTTLVYPQRLRNEYIDGSNLDIKNHRNILLSGRAHELRNQF